MSGRNKSILPSVSEPEENGSGDCSYDYESDFETDEDSYAALGKKRFRWNENRQEVVTVEAIDKRLNVHLEAMKMDREQDRQSTRCISKPALKKPNRPTKRSQLIPARLPIQQPSPTPQPPATRYPVDRMHVVDERIVEKQSAARESAAVRKPVHSNLIGLRKQESSLNPPSPTKLMAPVPPPPRQQPSKRRPKLGKLRKIEVTEDLNLKSPRAKSPKTPIVPTSSLVTQPTANTSSPLVTRPPMEPRPQSNKRRPNPRLRKIEVIEDVNFNTHYSLCKEDNSSRPTAVPQPPCEVTKSPRAKIVSSPSLVPQPACDVANTSSPLVPRPPIEPRLQSHKRSPNHRLRKIEVIEDVNLNTHYSSCKVEKSLRPTAVPQPTCDGAKASSPLVSRAPIEPRPQSHKRRPNPRLRNIEVIEDVNLNTHYSSCKVEKSLRPTAVPQHPCEIAESSRAQIVPIPPLVLRCDGANTSNSVLVPRPPMEPRPQSHTRRPKLGRLRKMEVTENVNLENTFSPSKVDTQVL